MQSLIQVAEAESIILDSLPNLPAETVKLPDAVGRVLREDLEADRDLPPFDRVMMDGVAISYAAYARGKRDFLIESTQAAGEEVKKLTTSDNCIEVMTGCPLPLGCDCVVPVEQIEKRGEIVSLLEHTELNAHQHIHPSGSDAAQNTMLVSTGETLCAPELAIAASCGYAQLQASMLPNILCVSTGDELVGVHENPLPHQIRRSHASALSASITQNHLGKASDAHMLDNEVTLREFLAEKIQSMHHYDVIVLTGGISKGKYDYVAPVMKELLGEAKFHGVAQRPGKPFAFWSKENAPPVFALPGNPVSVMACAARYLFPALRKMRGEKWSPCLMPLAKSFGWQPPLTGLIASNLMNGKLYPCPPRNSGDYTALAGTHGVCEIPSASQQEEGQVVAFYPW